MSIDLTLEDGGMGTDAEAPGFGDAYFASYLAEELDVEVVGDPLASDPRMARVEDHPNVEVKFLRVMWGNMSRGPEADATLSLGQITDWTGNASITDGLLMPLRTLHGGMR